MKTSLHLPDTVAQRLDNLVKRKSETKNKIIVDALIEYLDKEENVVDWSPQFLAWAELPPEEEGLEIEREAWREVEL